MTPALAVTSWDSSVTTYSLHTLATTIQEERQKLEGQARSGWNITVSCLTEQLSQVEQLNEKTWKVGGPSLI
jgi:hypothetical protein